MLGMILILGLGRLNKPYPHLIQISMPAYTKLYDYACVVTIDRVNGNEPIASLLTTAVESDSSGTDLHSGSPLL
jgi:hypothetical protein